MIHFRLLLISCVLPALLSAQNLNFVKKQVELLTAPEMHGRGYVNDGSNKAADFIRDQFVEIGLKPVVENYFQPFTFEVNTFPSALSLNCNGKSLVPGADFLVDAASGSTTGSFKIFMLDSSHFETVQEIKIKKNHIPLVDLTGIDSPDEVAALHEFKQKQLEKGPMMVLNPNKLMWSVSPQRYRHALIEVMKDRICDRPKNITMVVENSFIRFEAKNVIGKIEGKTNGLPIVITAHYDHLGRMGQAIFPGASDNASGTATLLDLASYFMSHPPESDIYFIAFAAEEAGLVGSKYFVDHPLIPLDSIGFLINLDLLGSAAKGITIVNGTLYPEEIGELAAINKEHNYVPKIRLRGKAANSDHYWFSEMGVKSIFIYTEGNAKAYHDVYDVPASLDWANYNGVFTLLVKFIESL